MAESYPLREQKKKRTHAQLIEAAEKLFLKQGFNNTTMDEVANMAGMHVQTLYRHFPSKTDLAIAINTSYFDDFEQAFQSRNTKTVTFWREWVLQNITDATSDGVEVLRINLKHRFTSQETPAAFYETDSKFEALLATGIAKDLGVSVSGDKRPMLIACMLWSGYKQTLRDWAMENRRRSLAKEVVDVIDTAIELLNMDGLLED